MKKILGVIFFVLGVYCLFMAYKWGYDLYWCYEHHENLILRPVQLISQCWRKILEEKVDLSLDLSNLNEIRRQGEGLIAIDRKVENLTISVLVILGIFFLGCFGRFFFFGKSSSDDKKNKG
ncbi:MAG: hypothetical protein PUB15_03165 [Ruminobacter sp.]|nr:hypothetical protein [Ruminobacter sp.]